MRRALKKRVSQSLALSLASVILAGSFVTPAHADPIPQGTYALNSRYNQPVDQTRGWKIEWRTPTVSNSNAWTAIGTWYYNLEAGIYRSGTNGWRVYYFGDDNGTTGNNPLCDTQWGTGGQCGGALGGFSAGKKIYFRYQACNASNAFDINGAYICLHVDMEDGAGWRFIARDSRGTVEMYAHDMEHFDPAFYPGPSIPCTTGNATKMVQQQRLRTDGVWANIGGNWWNFEDNSSSYKFQNVNTGVTPSNWESCSG